MSEKTIAQAAAETLWDLDAELKAAEERGRRSAETERDELRAALRVGVDSDGLKQDCPAAAWWECGNCDKFLYDDNGDLIRHGCAACNPLRTALAPRDSAPLSAKDRAHAEDVADRYERGEFHCKCGKPITAEHPRCP